MGFNFKVDTEEYNTSVADQGSFEPMPNGVYEVELLGLEIVDFTKKTESPYFGEKALAFVWRVTDSNEEFAKRRLWDRVGLFPKFKNEKKSVNFSLMQFLAAVGITPDEEGNIEIPDVDELLDAGLVVHVDVAVEKDDKGVDRNVVKRYLTEEQVEKRRKSASAAKVTKDTPKANGLFA